VPEVKRNAKIVFVALAGVTVGAVLSRLRKPAEPPPLPDERAEELRRKLAEARAAAADQDDFEVAGMGAETIFEEEPRLPTTGAPPEPPPSTGEQPPQDEFEAMRRRIHEEGKAAAEEMRRSADQPEPPESS
jgi:hypothetical protein